MTILLQVFLTEISSQDFRWAWGEMRGGTPALRVDSNHYLSFFHSSGHLTSKKIFSYVMGAYLFSRLGCGNSRFTCR